MPSPNITLMSAGYTHSIDYTIPGVVTGIPVPIHFPTTADAVPLHLATIQKAGVYLVIVTELVTGFSTLYPANGEPVDLREKGGWWGNFKYLGPLDQITPDADGNPRWWLEIEHIMVGRHVFLLD